MLTRDIEKVDKFLTFIDNCVGESQITDFFSWCIDHGMMANITDEDLEWCYENNSLSLPLLNSHKITIGIDFWADNKIRIGVDPSYCYNKVASSSIIAILPLKSRRNIVGFYRLLEQLLNKNTDISRRWFKDASTCWYGSFATFE